MAPTLGQMIAAIGSPAEWGGTDTSKLYWDEANSRLKVTGIISLSAVGTYRSVNNDALYLSGGNDQAVGGHAILCGGAHASYPSWNFYRATQHKFQTQNGGTDLFSHNGSDFYVTTGTSYVNAVSLSNIYMSAPSAGLYDAVTRNATNGWFYVNTSSEQYKENIERNWTHKEFLKFLTINPIRFDFKRDPTDTKADPADKLDPKFVGFSAEEVAVLGLPGLVNHDANGLPSSLRDIGFITYHHLILQDFESRIKIIEGKVGL